MIVVLRAHKLHWKWEGATEHVWCASAKLSSCTIRSTPEVGVHHASRLALLVVYLATVLQGGQEDEDEDGQAGKKGKKGKKGEAEAKGKKDKGGKGDKKAGDKRGRGEESEESEGSSSDEGEWWHVSL